MHCQKHYLVRSNGVSCFGEGNLVSSFTWFSTQVSEVISSTLTLLSTTSLEKNDNRWMLNTWGNFTVFYASWDWHNAVYQDEEKGSHCSVTREMHQVLKWKHVEQICVSVDLNQFTCRIFFWKQHNLGILNFERSRHQQFCCDFSHRLTVYYLLR